VTTPPTFAKPRDATAFRQDSSYAWYVAGLLAVAYAVAFIDRQVLNLLVDPIKGSLQLTDTQVSLLQGLAFVGAYVAMGPVFGRLGDQGNRRNLLIVGVVLWCISTVMCGFADDFWSLFVARAGVGGAEAVLLPACWSLLSDYFSRDKLPRAMSIFLLGPFVGGGLALIFGGLIVRAVTGVHFDGVLGGLEPWQLTFIFVGAPGILIALLLLTVREPPRQSVASQADRSFSLTEVAGFLWRERNFYGRFFCGMALLVVSLYALPAWTPTFLMRAHEGSRAAVGIEYGTATLLAGTLGVLLGPWIARLLSRRYPVDALVRTAIVAALGAAPACLLLPFAPSYWTALILSAVASFFMNFALPTAASALQASTPNRMRGLVTSAYAFVLTTVGLGLAPTLIAVVNDRLLRDPTAIGRSLGWVCGIATIASIPLVIGAARRYAGRLASAHRD
jgi:MFS family permease